MKLLLGIDYGTGGCKVTALGTDGSFAGEASVEYTTYHDAITVPKLDFKSDFNDARA